MVEERVGMGVEFEIEFEVAFGVEDVWRTGRLVWGVTVEVQSARGVS